MASESNEDPRATLALVAGGNPWRTGLSYSLISMGIGLVVVALMGLGNPALYSPMQFAFGALFGLCISTGAWLFEYALILLARGRLRSWPLRVTGYFLGGGAGHLVAYAITRLLFGDSTWEPTGLLLRTFVFAAFAALIGLGFYAYERLKQRLDEREEALRRKEIAEALAERELGIARSIQERLLPPPETRGPGFSVAARNVAAQVVAGDFYDVFREGDKALCLVVADVAGKGVGASLLMASVKAMLPLLAADRSVEETLDALNDRLHEDLAPREFVALALARLDLETGELRLANAGLPDPVVLRSGARPEPLVAPGERLPLGARGGSRYSAAVARLGEGDRLLMYTDGLPEARRDGVELGYEGFLELAARTSATPSEWLDGLLADLGEGVPVDDDRTLLALERLPPPQAALSEAAVKGRRDPQTPLAPAARWADLARAGSVGPRFRGVCRADLEAAGASLGPPLGGSWSGPGGRQGALCLRGSREAPEGEGGRARERSRRRSAAVARARRCRLGAALGAAGRRRVDRAHQTTP